MSFVPDRAHSIITSLLVAEFPDLTLAISEVNLDKLERCLKGYYINEVQIARDILKYDEDCIDAVNELEDIYQPYDIVESYSCNEWRVALRKYAMQLTDQAVNAEFHIVIDNFMAAIADYRSGIPFRDSLLSYVMSGD